MTQIRHWKVCRMNTRMHFKLNDDKHSLASDATRSNRLLLSTAVNNSSTRLLRSSTELSPKPIAHGRTPLSAKGPQELAHCLRLPPALSDPRTCKEELVCAPETGQLFFSIAFGQTAFGQKCCFNGLTAFGQNLCFGVLAMFGQMCSCIWLGVFLCLWLLCSTFLGVFNIFGRGLHFLGVFYIFWACSTFFGRVLQFLGVFQHFWACSTFLPPSSPPRTHLPQDCPSPGPPKISLFSSLSWGSSR